MLLIINDKESYVKLDKESGQTTAKEESKPKLRRQIVIKRSGRNASRRNVKGHQLELLWDILSFLLHEIVCCIVNRMSKSVLSLEVSLTHESNCIDSSILKYSVFYTLRRIQFLCFLKLLCKLIQEMTFCQIVKLRLQEIRNHFRIYFAASMLFSFSNIIVHINIQISVRETLLLFG